MSKPKSTPQIRLQLAGQLKKLRKKFGLTQEGMSERIGMDIRYYQRLESKTPNATKIDTLDRLAKAFKTTPSKLLDF